VGQIANLRRNAIPPPSGLVEARPSEMPSRRRLTTLPANSSTAHVQHLAGCYGLNGSEDLRRYGSVVRNPVAGDMHDHNAKPKAAQVVFELEPLV